MDGRTGGLLFAPGKRPSLGGFITHKLHPKNCHKLRCILCFQTPKSEVPCSKHAICFLVDMIIHLIIVNTYSGWIQPYSWIDYHPPNWERIIQVLNMSHCKCWLKAKPIPFSFPLLWWLNHVQSSFSPCSLHGSTPFRSPCDAWCWVSPTFLKIRAMCAWIRHAALRNFPGGLGRDKFVVAMICKKRCGMMDMDLDIYIYI